MTSGVAGRCGVRGWWGAAALVVAMLGASGVQASGEPNLTGFRPEHSVWPEQVPAPPLVVTGRNSGRDSERFGLLGPVRSVAIKIERNSAAFGGPGGAGGEPAWAEQGPAVSLAFDRLGIMTNSEMGGDLGMKPLAVTYTHQFEGEGAERRCVGRTWTIAPRRKDEVPTTWTETRTFDSKGRLLTIESRSSDGQTSAEHFTLDDAGRIVSLRIESDVEPEIYLFDSKGRLTGLTSDPAAAEQGGPGVTKLHWIDDTRAKFSRGDGQAAGPPADLEIDEHGVLKNWVFPMGPRSIRLANAVDYDARGNWTSITTSAAIDPAKPDELKPMLRYTRVIEYFDDAKGEKPAGK